MWGLVQEDGNRLERQLGLAPGLGALRSHWAPVPWAMGSQQVSEGTLQGQIYDASLTSEETRGSACLGSLTYQRCPGHELWVCRAAAGQPRATLMKRGMSKGWPSLSSVLPPRCLGQVCSNPPTCWSHRRSAEEPSQGGRSQASWEQGYSRKGPGQAPRPRGQRWLPLCSGPG